MIAWIVPALVVALSPIPADEVAGGGPETVTLRGEVVRLVEVLGSFGVPEQQGPIEGQVVLRKEGGGVVPLLYNVGSRAFFEDDRLRDRPAELVARTMEGLPYLQVVSARVEDGSGELRTPEYYCDICTISVRYDQPCPCCQSPMELRYTPED
ncbi:hypothetical protein [Tautonia plasticadhaerens]|uniref:Uncharacterized protein n=1 Tax=Tautonia plasticadhaerens TaxID=2527974 RepID=A0A518HCN1_9BACT|nr:hypothetical protein [Tautonia plasticadhaerens]QDV38590.1 hypothetical protein ElP_65450 [Tautonia plasticadhaerens]